MDIFKGVDEVLPHLDYSWLRQKVILSNLANADTPFYKEKDVKFKQVYNAFLLKTNNKRHIQPVKEGTYFEIVQNDSPLVGNDKNNVSIEEQMAKANANQIAYETYMKMINGNINELNTVIKGG